MPMTITDEELRAMHMDEREARIEFACRLYDADKLSKSVAARLARLSRSEFEGELSARGLPWIRVTDPDHLERELEALERMGAGASRREG